MVRVRRRNESGRQPTRAVTDHRLETEREKTDHALREAMPPVEAKTEAHLEDAREHVDRKLEHGRERAKKLAPEAKPVIDAAAAAAEQAIDEERRRTDHAVEREREDKEHVVGHVLARERQDTNRALADERAESDELIDARDELFATISHDLRNLINAIHLKSQLLQKELAATPRAPRARQLADEINRSTHMMRRWSNDLVDLASVNTGRLRVVFAEEDVVAIVARAVELCATLAEEKGLKVEVHVPDHASTIECDADRIVEAVINLLENATRHTARGGAIRVTLEETAEDVRIHVADTGSGIAKDQLRYVFDRYFQGQRTTRTGIGMGLYICRHIVERHGGRISVESTVDVGSTFTVTLPRRHG